MRRSKGEIIVLFQNTPPLIQDDPYIHVRCVQVFTFTRLAKLQTSWLIAENQQ